MREYSSPAVAEIPPTANLADVVFERAEREPRAVAIRRKDADGQRALAGRHHGRVPHRRGRAGQGADRGGDRRRRPGRAAVPDPVRVDGGRLRHLVGRRGHRADLRDLVRRAGGVDPRRLRRPGADRRDPGPPAGQQRGAGPAAQRATDLADRGPDAAGTASAAGQPGRRRRQISDDELAGRRGGAAGRATWPRSSTPRGPPAVPRAASSATPTCWPTCGTRSARCRRSSPSPGRSALLFLPLAHFFARIIQVGCLESGTCSGTPRSREPGGRPGHVPADVHPGRAPGVREGLQRRRAAGRGQRGEEPDLRRRGAVRGGLEQDAGPGRQARPGPAEPAAARRARAVRPAGLRQAAGGHRRPGAVRGVRRRRARRAARALLPRRRAHRAGGLRADRDQPGDAQPAGP